MIKQYQHFFLVTAVEPGTNETDDIKPVNEEFFQVIPLPVIFNSRKCLRSRKEKTIKIMSLKELKDAS